MLILSFVLRSFISITIAHAIPQIAFPINSQVPPLAQVSQPYSFQFSPNTFTSTDPGAPAWLCLESSTRNFFGTPNATDVGDCVFQVVGTDGSGSTALSVTLVVTKTPAPRVSGNITDILAKAGPLQDPSSLSIYPEATFSVSFPESTFANESNLTFYATSADRSPLPSWIRFDHTTNTFSGIAPPPVPNPQVIDIRLIASSVVGFAGQSVAFNLVISDHRFTFTSVALDISVNSGDVVHVPNPLLLDDELAPQNSIASTKAKNAPDWLQFNSTTLTFTGQAPSQVDAGEIEVVASDIFNDNAYSYLTIHSKNPPLGSSLPSSVSSPPVSSISATNIQLISPSSSGRSELPAPASHSSKRRWAAVAIAVPVSVVGLVVALVIWCMWFRKRSKHPESYVEHFATSETSKEGACFGRRRPQAIHSRPKTAGKKQWGSAGNNSMHTTFALSTSGSPMGSPEQRIWESNERSLSGLGLFVPQPRLRNENAVHPLRSNRIKRPKKLTNQRSIISYPDEDRDSIKARGGRGYDQASRASSVLAMGREHEIVIPKCDNCDSNKLKCLDCGSRQIKSALEILGTHRRSTVEAGYLPNLRRIVDDGLSKFPPLTNNEKERERREAQEYIKRPLEEKFQNYQSRKKGQGTRERFSNSGSGSYTSSYGMRRWRSDIRREQDVQQADSVRSEHSIPGDCSSVLRGHMTDVSQDSETSWVTEGQANSREVLSQVFEPEEERIHKGRRQSRGLGHDVQAQLERSIQKVQKSHDADGMETLEASAGMQEENISSDDKALL